MKFFHSRKSCLGRAYWLCASAFCLIAFPAWSACKPDPDAPVSESPYVGYVPNAVTGKMERDPLWHQAVRHLRKGENGQLFELRNQPGILFDSIEPIDLGGGVKGFVAMREGCKQLLNRQGKPLRAPLFNAVESEVLAPKVLSPGQTLLRLKFEESYMWVRIDRGRFQAISPRPYLLAHSRSSLDTRQLPPYLRAVAASFDNGHGLVDLRTLKEVLLPEWSGVTGVGVNGDIQTTRYLIAAHGRQRILFPLDGGAPLLKGITSLEVINNWFPFQQGRPAVNSAVMIVRMEGDAGCRLLDMRLTPLIPQLLPARHDDCNVDRLRAAQKYLITDADGQTVHAYAIEPEGRLRWLSSTPGQLDAAVDSTGLMVVRVQTEQGTVHRTYFVNGTRAREEDYTGFQNLGCGFLRVVLNGQWFSLYRDGTTSSKMYFPFSC